MTLSVTVLGLLGVISLQLSIAGTNRNAALLGEATTIVHETAEFLRRIDLTDPAEMPGTLVTGAYPGASHKLYSLPTLEVRGVKFQKAFTIREIPDDTLLAIMVEVIWHPTDGTALDYGPNATRPNKARRIELEFFQSAYLPR